MNDAKTAALAMYKVVSHDYVLAESICTSLLSGPYKRTPQVAPMA